MLTLTINVPEWFLWVLVAYFITTTILTVSKIVLIRMKEKLRRLREAQSKVDDNAKG